MTALVLALLSSPLPCVSGQDRSTTATAQDRVGDLLATLSTYRGPPRRLPRTGRRPPAPLPQSFAAAWVCGADGAGVPATSLVSRLPELRRSPDASRSALLARSHDEDPAVVAWALVALAALGQPDARTLERFQEHATAGDVHVRRSAGAILFHEGDPGGVAERALEREVERDGVDLLALRMLSARHDIGAGLATAITTALRRDLPRDRTVYTLRVVRRFASRFAPAVPRIEALARAAGRDAVMALGAIGEAAVPSLARIASMRAAYGVRESALGALQGLGETARAAFADVSRVARSADETRQLRQQAIRTLSSIGAGEPARLGRLLRQLLTDEATRHVAAVALLRHATMPAGRATAIDVIDVIDTCGRGGWSGGALLALCALGPDEREVAPRIVSAWKKGRFSTATDRIFALRALGAVGAADDDSIRLIASALDDPERGAPGEAIEVLRRLAPRGRAALPKLMEQCRHDDAERRSSAAAAVLAFEPESVVAWKVLDSRIESANAQVRGAALRALASHWEESAKARALVRDRLDDTDVSLRVAACRVVIERVGSDERIVRTLVEVLRMPNTSGQWPAVRLLGAVGAKAADALPLLRARIYDLDRTDAWAAREATDRIRRALERNGRSG